MSSLTVPPVVPLQLHTSSEHIRGYENLNFLNFQSLRDSWNLLSERDPVIHDRILDSIVNGNLIQLDKGYSKRYQVGKLEDQAFNLLDSYTWDCCICCEMRTNPLYPDRYTTPNRPCGKSRYCPRCAFRAEQSFWRKYSGYWTSGLDFYHITFGEPSDFHVFDLQNIDSLLLNFHSKNRRIHVKLSNLLHSRTRYRYLLGALWSEEASCLNLLHNTWSSHLHCIIACPKGSVLDLSYFDDLGMDNLSKPILTKSYFDNCLRYLCKPMTGTLKDQYRVHWTPERSSMLYRRVRNDMEILQLLYNKRRKDALGYFRNPLSDS